MNGNKQLRILALMTDAYGGYGGIAQANRDLLEAWALSEDVQYIAILPRLGKKAVGLPQKTIQLSSVFKPVFYIIKSMWTILTKGPFDVIFCGHINMTPLAMILKRIFKVPYWLHLHGVEAWENPGMFRRKGAEGAICVTCVSRYTRKKFLSWATYNHHHATILPNTVAEKFKPSKKSKNIMKKFQLDGKRIILTTGRLSSLEKYKGHEQVLRALPFMLLKIPNIVYLIVGDGDDRYRLEKIAKDLDLMHVVRFTGFLNEEELIQAYQTSDLFIMPSTGEGFGIVFLEAMACGLPVIACDSDGSIDPLGDSDLLVSENRSPEALSNLVVKGLLSNHRIELSLKRAELFNVLNLQNYLKVFLRRIVFYGI